MSGWRWGLGLAYIVAVATIWIAASFVVRSVVGDGVSPFLLTYICNSLFIIYLPLVEIGRFLEDSCRRSSPLPGTRPKPEPTGSTGRVDPEEFVLLRDPADPATHEPGPGKDGSALDERKGRWTRTRVAKASILVCPFWFMAQLTFNLSLKYTTVTSNTILSSASSLFTYVVAVVWLEERFLWAKLVSVLLCMAGTIAVGLGDSDFSAALNPVLGDALALLSAALYAVYVTLIRKSLPSDPDPDPDPDPDLDRVVGGRASTAQFLGFMGLFNLLLFLPAALLLLFYGSQAAYSLSWNQLGLIVGKGLLDNVLSDYLWAKAVLLTSATVATAGLAIQVPLAAVVDSLTGNSPRSLDYVGAAAVILGFIGINLPSHGWFGTLDKGSGLEIKAVDDS